MATFYTDLSESCGVNVLCDEDDESGVKRGGRGGRMYSNSVDTKMYSAQIAAAEAAYARQMTAQQISAPQIKLVPGTESQTGLMKTVIEDIKTFIREHRNIIYITVAILIIDHFFLGGKLKERIRVMAEKLFGSVERKIDRITTPDAVVVPPKAP